MLNEILKSNDYFKSGLLPLETRRQLANKEGSFRIGFPK